MTAAALRARCSVGLIATIAATIRFAAAEQLPLKFYTTSDGLPSDRIHCVLSDSRGFLWFGTADGISRFDGYSFTNLTTRDGLPGTDVYAIVPARDGTFWAATNGGLFHWDPAGARGPRGLREIVHPASDPGANDVRALLEDRSGGLWVGTHAGLYRLENSGGTRALRRLPLEAPERRESGLGLVNALREDADGTLWIGTEGGLFRRRPTGAVERVRTRDGLPHAVRCLRRQREGPLWIGSHSEGVFEIGGPSAPGGTGIHAAFSHANGLAGNFVTSLFESSDGRMWAGCFGGLTEFAADGTLVRSYSTPEGLSYGVWSLGEDRDRDLWIGSEDAGVLRLARDGFRRFDGRDGLASTCIDSVFENNEGQPCVFTRGTGAKQVAADESFIECFDGRRFHSARPRVLPGTNFGWGTSQIALQDGRGEWWVPTTTGLYRFPSVPLARLEAALPRRIYTERDGLPSNVLFRLFPDSRGNLWAGFAAGDRRVALWDRASDSFRSFSPEDGLPAEEPLAFAEDRAASVWIGFPSGLARIRGTSVHFFRRADGLPRGGVEAILLDRDGRLWIACDAGGVARLDRPEEERPLFRRYGVEQGLASGKTFSLTEDRQGRIYVGTAHGLDRLDPANGLVQHFTADDGLPRGDIEDSFRDRQGNLWFGSAQGLSRLEPVADVPRRPPSVRIAQVIADGVRQSIPELGASEVRLPELGPGSAPVQIDFLAIDFAPGGRPRYQYRLEGVDSDWSAVSDQRSVVYARLPAGRYRFQVRALANDGSLGKAPAEVIFTILPPLWRRPELLAVAAALMASLVYLLHRYRLRNALAVERVRIRVATDLHDDVGAGLSEIAILSEVARRKPGEPQSDRSLGEIGDAARRLVDSMSDIIWSTDPSKDDVSSLALRIRRFAANVLESQGIHWSLEVPPETETRRLDPEIRRQVLLIVKEALTNVARHSGCERVALRIAVEAHELAVDVEDDGRGFSVLDVTPGQGLGNMRSRALSLVGSFRIERPPSGGTHVAVRVPLHQTDRRTRGRREPSR